MGGELSRVRRPHRRHVRHGEDVRRTASCASKARSPRSPPTRRSTAATTPRRRTKGIEAYGMVWAAWLYSQEWWRRELWKTNAPPGTRSSSTCTSFARNFIPGADANDLILQARTWEQHDVGTTPGFNGDVGARAALDQGAVPLHAVGNRSLLPGRRRALRSSIHPAFSTRPDSVAMGTPRRRGGSPADEKFLNEKIGQFLAGRMPAQ